MAVERWVGSGWVGSVFLLDGWVFEWVERANG